MKWMAFTVFALFSAYVGYGDKQDFDNHRGNYTPEKEALKAAEWAKYCLEQAEEGYLLASCR
jgi:hypothetical protein